ncbi:hypothetical protein AB4076_13325 [Dyella sp. 2RAF44]|uniref:hypothetical protein n=1 Tax=Dyella sp. 2RAF44 TaxID=3233000 RepID=UPI003F8F721F
MMSRVRSSALFVVTSLVCASTALAGGQSGNVTNVSVRQSDGVIYFTLDGTPTGRAACAASNNLWIIANENSESGKKQFAQLLAAKMNGTPITVLGTGACTRWPDSEDADTVTF